MPFGLKNAGSTYQRMMTRMFEPQLGKNIEVYIDDMVVKSKVVSEHMGTQAGPQRFQVLFWSGIRKISRLYGYLLWN